MTVAIVRMLYHHGAWADARVLDYAARLTPEQLTAPGTAGHGSIRDTLVHAIATQRAWLTWLDGSLPPEEAMRLRIDPATLPDVPAVREQWAAVQEQTQRFLARLTGDDLNREMTSRTPWGGTLRATLGELVVHVACHGTQHRSEVAAMLTAFGQSPGNLDVLRFILEGQPTSPAGQEPA
ncbi:MAG: DinB family protein [Sphaerobacter sp.]|nr:DinB family protein [Sphaerobacter sp.]